MALKTKIVYAVDDGCIFKLPTLEVQGITYYSDEDSNLYPCHMDMFDTKEAADQFLKEIKNKKITAQINKLKAELEK